MTYRPPSRQEKEQYWKSFKIVINLVIKLLIIVSLLSAGFAFFVYTLFVNQQMFLTITVPLIVTIVLSFIVSIVVFSAIRNHYYMKKRRRNGYYAEFMNAVFGNIAIFTLLFVLAVYLMFQGETEPLYWYIVGVFAILGFIIPDYLKLRKEKPPVSHMTEELASKRALYIEQLMNMLKDRNTVPDFTTSKMVLELLSSIYAERILLPHYYYLEYVLPYDTNTIAFAIKNVEHLVHQDIKTHKRENEYNKCSEYLENKITGEISIFMIKDLLN